ncbi:helix-turn-helix transcriptional regulator [Vibrio cincinnatiensis]|uniref:helix-turn-helix transcriptional regulator n=1 Tax=Vibrio cincinnatiensis TaxID=675 RepID=UPI001EDD1526|nr:helix-turn-helix transcriptional regulator [Vibrio cincinnatiensis]
MVNMMIKDVLKSARNELNLSQEEVAEAIGITKQTYLKWENGTTEPKATQVVQLSKVLKVSPNEICTGVRNERMDLEEFILNIALAKVPNEIVTMYSWKMIPDHATFFSRIRGLSEDEYYSDYGEVSSTEAKFRGV